MCGRCAAIIGNLHFEVHVEYLMPRQSLLAQLGEERIGIELLDVEHPGTAPQPLGPHRGAQRCGNARRERHGLRAGLTESLLVVAVVIDIVCLLYTSDAADE